MLRNCGWYDGSTHGLMKPGACPKSPDYNLAKRPHGNRNRVIGAPQPDDGSDDELDADCRRKTGSVAAEPPIPQVKLTAPTRKIAQRHFRRTIRLARQPRSMQVPVPMMTRPMTLLMTGTQQTRQIRKKTAIYRSCRGRPSIRQRARARVNLEI